MAIAASMSSTATPMWSILPNKAASLCGRRRLVRVDRPLGAEDLRQRRQTDLELLRRRLLGRQAPLDLPPGRVKGLGQGVAVVAVAPGEHLDRDRGTAQAAPGAGGPARTLDA